MNLWDIAKKVGLGMLTTAVPGAGAIIATVNAILPDDEKLPETATGQQLEAAINKLPADKRAELMMKEFDVEITLIQEGHSTLRAMLAADAINPHSTRPKMAYQAFQVVAFLHIAAALGLFYAIWKSGSANLVKDIMDGWPFLLALTAPFVSFIKGYNGILETEQRNKLQTVAGGSPVAQSGIVGVLSSLLANKKG